MEEHSQNQQFSQFYSELPVSHFEIEDATFAMRKVGRGPDLLFIHGFPTHGYTWRKILPALSKHFTCHIIDLPGLGDSHWENATDFALTAQAWRVVQLLEQASLTSYSIIAHNTGATIARLVALLQSDRVHHLVMINTEIPNHRPPWIEFFQKLSKLPGANFLFRQVMKSKTWQRSNMGFGQFYSDKTLFNDPLGLAYYVNPLIASKHRMAGMLHYLRGVEWSVVDNLEEQHKNIRAEVMMLWGERDKTFPIETARPMIGQFESKSHMIALPAALMPHEECPELVLENTLRFLQS